MMICDADFEELFPDLFPAEKAPAARQEAKSPNAECISRWEDDGGLHLNPEPRRRFAAIRHPAFGYDMEGLARAGMIAAAAPAIATYATASTMLSAYDEMTTRREVMA